MKREPNTSSISRRELLRGGAVLAGGAFLVPRLPAWARPFVAENWQAAADPVAKMRADIGATPIERVKLTDNLTMLSGPGGNVVVLNGPDGKIVVDSFVQTAWTNLKQTLDAIGNAPIRTLEEVVKAAPTAAFDPTWGKGFMSPAAFIGVVYNTLR